jgi:hypothetical protein
MRTLIPAVAVLVLSATLVQGQETPHAVVQRAIAAHGGQERLSRVRADRVRSQGTLFVGTSSVPFRSETTVQLPSQFKNVIQVTTGNQTKTVVHLLDGDKAAILIDGQPQPVSAALLAQLRQTLQLNHLTRLVPLLTDPEFTLAWAGETTINGRPAVGVRVTGRSQRPVCLYFDKPSGLLVKAEQTLDGPGGRDVKQEAWYSGYRDLGGYRRPGKVTAYRDGQKVMEAELLEAEALGQIDPKEFTRP